MFLGVFSLRSEHAGEFNERPEMMKNELITPALHAHNGQQMAAQHSTPWRDLIATTVFSGMHAARTMYHSC